MRNPTLPSWWTVAGCVLLSLTLPFHLAFAWGPGGHMVTASIAWESMKPETRQKVAAILQAHPAVDIYRGQMQKDNPADQGAYLFSKASNWPDEIRRHGSPYDHPLWHYIDYPLQPPDFPFIAGLDPEDNIVFGIDASEKSLADPASNLEQKAAALSWIIHLVGDIHQPLHCSTLVKPPTYVLPVGDKGGNGFYVSVGGAPINLHAFWDRLPGQIFSPPYAAASAERIRKTYPPNALPELAKDKDPCLLEFGRADPRHREMLSAWQAGWGFRSESRPAAVAAGLLGERQDRLRSTVGVGWVSSGRVAGSIDAERQRPCRGLRRHSGFAGFCDSHLDGFAVSSR